MKNPSKIFTYILVVLLWGLTILFLYQQSLPKRYSLVAGEISPYDINTQKELVDDEATEKRARQAAARTERVLVRSDAISNASIERVKEVAQAIDQSRSSLREAARLNLPNSVASTPSEAGQPAAADGSQADTPKTAEPSKPTTTEGGTSTQKTDSDIYVFAPEQLQQFAQSLRERLLAFNMSLDTDSIQLLLELHQSVYSNYREQLLHLAQEIMSKGQDRSTLQNEIQKEVASVVETSDRYQAEYALLETLLSQSLQPNLVYDANATEAARQANFLKSVENPVLIPAGTRILSVGEVVTAEHVKQLASLGLLERHELDVRHLLAITLLVSAVATFMLLFIRSYRSRRHKEIRRGDQLVLLLTFGINLVAAALLTRMSPYLMPMVFTSTIVSVYFGLRMSLGLSLLTLLLLLPLTYQDPAAMFVQIWIILVSSMVGASYQKRNKQVQLILFPAVTAALASLLFGLFQKQTLFSMAQNMLQALMATGLGAVLAIGIMPLYELFLSTVSPMRLIQLAQPSQPLLRRLFLEAPGTNQHSMMVANLAEAAAEQLGLDSLLVRVGAYYHDIGKLDHPEMFTENQSDFNPHDRLAPEDSAAFIIAHVERGLKTAKRYRLPLPIQSIITEHHGNTLQASFYYKAVEIAKAEGREAPPQSQFRYPWHIPRSPESAVVMLADSMEAAMKSTKTQDLEGAEILARNIVKGKIDQDQLRDSGLSFADLEVIIRAFLQVYQGQFHERVSYPNARMHTSSK